MSNRITKQPFYKPRIMHSLHKHWRRHGVKYCLLMLIGWIWSAKIAGVAMLLMLTVPCGIEKVNTDKRLWVLRQLYFAGIGLFNLLTQ